MLYGILTNIIVISVFGTLADLIPEEATEEEAKEYIKQVNDEFLVKWHEKTLAEWDYEANMTDANEAHMLAVEAEVFKFQKTKWEVFSKFPRDTYKDADLRRQLKIHSTIVGEVALPEEKNKRFSSLVAEMTNIFNSATICDYYDKTICGLSLEPDLENILMTSRNEPELKYVWVEFHKQTAKDVKPLYEEYVALSNEASIAIGNMWAHTWTGLLDFTIPFNDVKVEDITANLVEQGYTPLKMFKMAEEFYLSMNLDKMVDTFWEKSIIEKPKDREIICHPTAFNFFDGKDFRIKMCAQVILDDLISIFQQMGYVENFMAFRNQPYVYQDGVNPAFFEAMGDTISLSVSTPDYLSKMGLLNSYTPSYEADINNLFLTALDKIAFLPFGLLLELWRFSVFDGTTPPQKYNEKYWQLRLKYQGVKPPVERTEDDFDACSKYHIVSDNFYLGYFLENIIQFQFYEALCVKAKEYDPGNPESKPLHHCSLYQSVEAGNLLKTILPLGKSKPWQDQMELLTGQRNMSVSSLLNYYQPLTEWLRKDNEKNGEFVGWDES